ncbi:MULTISPECIES: hypothetical protein [Paenibacillus]|jgi:drug/metabolite transporter (DMT)-like permease|uniref:EamA domain-containing protein n=1 Tax=Paenibacillus azoreducens TaxID=116718 RepID=A0A919YI55_9BACL|nr:MULTISPECIES: hypothetical protein [Paenibacillus]MBE9916110.1 hypothetical protein [Paenibacillus donghaensis]GIO51199.1 hypothetical protein J34TS1_59640 [Paenibacillus azoreducens]
MHYVYSFFLLVGGLSIINAVFSFQSKHIDPHFWETAKFQLLMLPLFYIANLCIGYGVQFGFKASNHLSLVLVTAKCLEIFISVAMGFLFLKEIPNWKTWLGLGIIIAGVVVAKLK